MAKSITRRTLLTGAGSIPVMGQRLKRPNILFIMPDQLRAQSLGFMGNSEVRTPNLDKLSREGTVFPTFANSPVCCPARANILTGNYAHRNGMVANDLRLRESEVSLAELLRRAGYRTGFVGKWHLDGGKRLPGFVPPGSRRQGFEYWAANECSHAHFNTHYFRDDPTPIAMNKFEAEGWTDLALEFLRDKQSHARPFLLAIQMGPPHDPYKAPPEYSALYDPGKLTMRPNWQAKPGHPGPREIAEYYGMITAVDEQIGRILRVLEQEGLADDTIVLVSSDHGDMLSSQGSRLKRKPWEESIRVPGILRFPKKVPKCQRPDVLFTHVDFAPTLLGLCGLTVPRAMQGTDLSAIVLGGTADGPDSAFFQIFGPYQGDGTDGGWRGVRTHRHMYAKYENRPWILYDLVNDPYQLRNLAGDPAAGTILADMEKRLDGWMRRTGDSWKYNWESPVEDKGRLYRHGTFYTVDEYLNWAKQHPELESAQ
jgi:arylsulfatase A-like enzyme